jgi:hypothetical protein
LIVSDEMTLRFNLFHNPNCLIALSVKLVIHFQKKVLLHLL